ncbi:hypothetical protein [Halovulum sp. GXIMD14793]
MKYERYFTALKVGFLTLPMFIVGTPALPEGKGLFSDFPIIQGTVEYVDTKGVIYLQTATQENPILVEPWALTVPPEALKIILTSREVVCDLPPETSLVLM